MTRRVLLTGGRAPATLDLARFFHHAGWKVYLAESCLAPITKGSFAITATFRVPEPKTNRQDFVDALSAIIKAHEIDLLVPTCEEVFYISQALTSLSTQCRVFTDDFHKLTRLHSKWAFSQMVQTFNITTPETHLLDTPEAVKPWAEESQDWVFKPVFSRFATYTQIRPKPKCLKQIQPTSQKPWVAQRFIPGTEYSTYSIAQNGKLQAHVTYHSKYRAGKGSGIYFTSVNQPEILSFTQDFVKQFAYTGQIAFDFRMNPEGEIYVLECNPRATSGLHLFSKKDALPIAFKEETSRIIQPAHHSSKMLGLIMPLYAWGSNQPTIHLFKDMLTTPDTVFSWQDPIPFFYQFISFGEIVSKSLRRQVSLRQAATVDLEWDGD